LNESAFQGEIQNSVTVLRNPVFEHQRQKKDAPFKALLSEKIFDWFLGSKVIKKEDDSKEWMVRIKQGHNYGVDTDGTFDLFG
jgi:hypothetical protein